jgi:hypothetical protein
LVQRFRTARGYLDQAWKAFNDGKKTTAAQAIEKAAGYSLEFASRRCRYYAQGWRDLAKDAQVREQALIDAKWWDEKAQDPQGQHSKRK